MNYLYKNILAVFMVLLPFASSAQESVQASPCKVGIILGSTRQGRMSEAIAQVIKNSLSSRTDCVFEIIDLREHKLPFFDDAVAPARRDKISDPVVQKWSDTITKLDAFILVVPEYNSGYPGVLKNALDSLYKEWNNKPVALIGYSGGESGGTTALDQLRQVTKALGMIPVEAQVTIPTSWKAFDTRGKLVSPTVEQELRVLVDAMVKVLRS